MVNVKKIRKGALPAFSTVQWEGAFSNKFENKIKRGLTNQKKRALVIREMLFHHKGERT